MNIFISANDKYCLAAQVMLRSFFINNPGESHTIYFMHTSTHADNIKKLSHLVEEYHGTFIPLLCESKLFENFLRTSRFPIEVYFRLLIPFLLPESEKRALWLDVDLIVNGSLSSFYNQNFDEKYIVACADPEDHRSRLPQLGCPSDSVYINSGVLLFNADKMRTYTLQDYFDYFQTHEKYIIFPDQDILNGMLTGKIKLADYSVYNRQIRCVSLLSREHLNHIRLESKITHYIGKLKPWHKSYYNIAAELWDHYQLSNCKYRTIIITFRRIFRWILRYTWRPLRNLCVQMYCKYKSIRAKITK